MEQGTLLLNDWKKWEVKISYFSHGATWVRGNIRIWTWCSSLYVD